MKKALAIGLLLASSSAFASKARMDALQSPIHIRDVVSAYNRPSDFMVIPEMMTFDLQAPGDVTETTRGGMLKGMGSGRLGFFVGVNANESKLDDTTTPTYVFPIENPFSVSYANKAGDIAWGLFFTYAASDRKTIPTKNSYMNLVGSVEMGDLIVGAGMSTNEVTGSVKLSDGTSQSAVEVYKNSPKRVFAQYAMGDWTLHGNFKMQTEELAVKTDTTELTVGALNSMKKDGADFFYGVSYVNNAVKDTNTTSTLPVLVGIEADAASWLTLRGSITQNVLYSSDKDQGADADTVPHSTNVAAGAGLKFNQAVLDITLNAAGTGNLNSNLGANAGLTYMF